MSFKRKGSAGAEDDDDFDDDFNEPDEEQFDDNEEVELEHSTNGVKRTKLSGNGDDDVVFDEKEDESSTEVKSEKWKRTNAPQVNTAESFGNPIILNMLPLNSKK